MTELVAGIGHRDRVGPVGNTLAGEDFGSLRATEPVRIETEVYRQRPVQFDQPRRSHRRRRNPREKPGRQRRIGILEGEMDRHGPKIGISSRIRQSVLRHAPWPRGLRSRRFASVSPAFLRRAHFRPGFRGLLGVRHSVAAPESGLGVNPDALRGWPRKPMILPSDIYFRTSMHRYRSHTCGALRDSDIDQTRSVVRLVPSHSRPWRRAVHRSARPLRPDAMRRRSGFAGVQGRRKAALGMGGADRRQGAPPSRRHRQSGIADRRGRALCQRDRGAGTGRRIAAAGVRRAGIS